MSPESYTQLKQELKKELFEELSDLFVRTSDDPEGKYRPEFVKKILAISAKTEPREKYSKKTFRKLIS